MLWTIIGIILAVWLLGFLFDVAGNLIHILLAVAAIVFCVVMHAGPKFYNKITKNPYLKILLGSVILVVLSLIFGRDYNGAGVPVIERALEGLARPEAFLLKLLFTSLTLGAGFKGGEIVPAFFCGATLGSFLGPILGLPASFGAAASMAAVFCGVTNCPLTSILLSYELFGGDSLPLYALCCAVSFMLSGHYSLYHSQVIRHSKLRMEKVNRHGH